MAEEEKLIKFETYSDAPYTRSNSVIISQLIDEINQLIKRGCPRELIYKSLTSEPYNLALTYKSFSTLISRARVKKRKNPSTSEGGAMKVQQASNSSGDTALPKGAKIFRKLNDAPKFEQNPNPSLDDLLKGNK
ncbi:hypothetical protein ACRWP7_003305 [Escherichia coli]